MLLFGFWSYCIYPEGKKIKTGIFKKYIESIAKWVPTVIYLLLFITIMLGSQSPTYFHNNPIYSKSGKTNSSFTNLLRRRKSFHRDFQILIPSKFWNGSEYQKTMTLKTIIKIPQIRKTLAKMMYIVIADFKTLSL